MVGYGALRLTHPTCYALRRLPGANCAATTKIRSPIGSRLRIKVPFQVSRSGGKPVLHMLDVLERASYLRAVDDRG